MDLGGPVCMPGRGNLAQWSRGDLGGPRCWLCLYIYLQFTYGTDVIRSLDVFKTPAWRTVEEVEDPDIQELAQLLLSIVLRGRAPSTVKKYSGAFLRWKRWAAQKFTEAIFPAQPLQVALYLAYLIQKSSTSAPVEEAVNALSWAHQMALVEDPTQDNLVKNVHAGAKRILAHRKTKKEPITAEILTKLVDKFANEDADLDDLRIVAICFLGFAGFLRFSELEGLKESDILIYADH